MADTEEKVAKLQKRLARLDRKLDRAGSGTEYNSLLIDRRDIEAQLWQLDPSAEVAVH